jgi:hypothetical protein
MKKIQLQDIAIEVNPKFQPSVKKNPKNFENNTILSFKSGLTNYLDTKITFTW